MRAARLPRASGRCRSRTRSGPCAAGRGTPRPAVVARSDRRSRGAPRPRRRPVAGGRDEVSGRSGTRAGRHTAVAGHRPRSGLARDRDAPSRSDRRLGRTPLPRAPGRSVPRKPSTRATHDRAVLCRGRRRRCNAQRRCRSCPFPTCWPSRRASRCCRSGSWRDPRPDSPPNSVSPRRAGAPDRRPRGRRPRAAGNRWWWACCNSPRRSSRAAKGCRRMRRTRSDRWRLPAPAGRRKQTTSHR